MKNWLENIRKSDQTLKLSKKIINSSEETVIKEKEFVAESQESKMLELNGVILGLESVSKEQAIEDNCLVVNQMEMKTYNKEILDNFISDVNNFCSEVMLFKASL